MTSLTRVGATAGETPWEPARARWNARWYAEGFYSHESLAEAIALRVGRAGGVELSFYRGADRVARHTAHDLHARSLRVAGGLHRLGLRPGDAICLQIPNSVENTVTCLAAIHLGLVIVPVVHIYGPHELGFIIRDSGARVLVVPRAWRKIDFLRRVSEITDQGPLEHLVVIGDDVPAGATAWRDLERADPLVTPAASSPDDTGLIVYTSGSTGSPKGVRHTQNNMKAGAPAGPPSFSSEPSPATLFGSPAGHIGGMLNVLFPFLTGIGGHYLDGWDAEVALDTISRFRLTRSSGAPLHLLTLVEAAERSDLDTSSFWYYVCGGASVPPATIERAEALGWKASRSYGSSENPTTTSCSDHDPLAFRASTDGGMSPGAAVRIVDEDGVILPPGREGEIHSVGPKLFAGYTDPALDAAAFTPDGWFRTGDVGRLDVHGHLTVTDRKKDIVIRAGENISSREVEDILVRHPAVLEAAVVGAPDPRYGERVCAFVRLRDGRSGFDLEAARHHFVDLGVARQKTPERIIVVDDFPRSANGKVRKPELRARLR